jgi:hypothetical protein
MSLSDKVEDFFKNVTEEELDRMVQEINDMKLPEYHSEGMGCGIEDNSITDRYEACKYGYESAVEDCSNDIISSLKDDLIAKHEEIYKLKESLAFYRKLSDDFDGTVRYMMVVAPQLQELLDRRIERLKEKKDE